MRLFLDSSALAKRYVLEVGSREVIERCVGADEIFLCVLVLPECISAFNRLCRDGALSRTQYSRLKEDLIADLEQATVIDLHHRVLARAITCLESNALRALDALHIGAARTVDADLFLTGDRRQHDVALAMGMTAELV